MQINLIKNIILGIVQGLTEFLPVSSSAHLVIFQEILGIREGQLLLDIILHFGTALVLVVFFWKDILKLAREIKLVGCILIVTVITGVIGIGGKDFFEGLFATPRLVGIALFITGAILLSTRKFMKGERTSSNFNIKDAVFLGLIQGFAIIPGISRSGVTISLMLFLGLRKEDAFRLSFLVSIPAIFGALILELRDLTNLSLAQVGNLSIGFVTAFLTGLVALLILKKLIRKSKFHVFGYYCILIFLLILFFFK
jgi:undecaprenyl-diphosphatase